MTPLTRKLLRSAALVAALVASTAAADDEATLLALPDSPAWAHGRAFVAAFNTGERAPLSRFLAQRLSARALGNEALKPRLAELERVRGDVGALEVVEASGVSHVLVLAARDADVIVIVSPDDPARLDDVRVVRNAVDGLALQESR